MSNERFRETKVGDIIYVYDHEAEHIYRAICESVSGTRFEPQTIDGLGQYVGCDIEFVIPIEYSTPYTSLKRGSFYIKYNEEKNKRGTKYTGFLTKEEAIEFKNYLTQMKIDELESQVKKLKERIKTT